MIDLLSIPVWFDHLSFIFVDLLCSDPETNLQLDNF